MAKSAIRRHHRERLIRKWEREHPLKAVEYHAINEKEWRSKAARVYTTTRTPCSCALCVSPRRLYGNAKHARTFQEMRHPVEFE